MTLEELRASLSGETPPPGLDAALEAMWHEAKGNWDRAHKLAQTQKDAAGAWVHAYLHRVEGDLGNAGHWYRRAGRDACAAPLAQEWAAITSELLDARV